MNRAYCECRADRRALSDDARIETLRNASLAVLDIVRRKDADAMWDAGEILDQACEACHRSYWYPGENAEFYGRLRRRLNEFGQNPPAGKIAKPQNK